MHINSDIDFSQTSRKIKNKHQPDASDLSIAKSGVVDSPLPVDQMLES